MGDAHTSQTSSKTRNKAILASTMELLGDMDAWAVPEGGTRVCWSPQRSLFSPRFLPSTAWSSSLADGLTCPLKRWLLFQSSNAASMALLCNSHPVRCVPYSVSVPEDQWCRWTLCLSSRCALECSKQCCRWRNSLTCWQKLYNCFGRHRSIHLSHWPCQI